MYQFIVVSTFYSFLLYRSHNTYATFALICTYVCIPGMHAELGAGGGGGGWVKMFKFSGRRQWYEGVVAV